MRSQEVSIVAIAPDDGLRVEVLSSHPRCAGISLQPEVKSPMPHVGRVMDFSKPMFGVSDTWMNLDHADHPNPFRHVNRQE